MNCTGKRCLAQYNKVDPATCTAVPYCPQATPPKTNADHIRAMTDEELADMFAEVSVKTIEALMDAFKITDYEYNKDGFARSWMDWLRSGADE